MGSDFWGAFSDDALRTKLFLAGLTIPMIQQAVECGDPRGELRMQEWERDRLAIVTEMGRRGLIEDQTVAVQTADIRGEVGNGRRRRPCF